MRSGFAHSDPRICADALVDAQRPGDFNQGMMELGATVCLPRGHCAWDVRGSRGAARGVRTRCRCGRAQQRQHSARVVWLRGAGEKQKVRLVQRAADASLMAEMWELPTVSACALKSTPEFTVGMPSRLRIMSWMCTVRSGCSQGGGEWMRVGVSGLPLG